MNHQDITVSKVIKRDLELRTLCVLAAGLIREFLVQVQAVKLPLFILIFA